MIGIDKARLSVYSEVVKNGGNVSSNAPGWVTSPYSTWCVFYSNQKGSKMAKTEKKVRFVGCEVSSAILGLAKVDGEPSLEEMIVGFAEATPEGLKMSFSWKEQQKAYNVSITLPVVGEADTFECASFWDGELFYALLQAYIVVFTYEALGTGFTQAKSVMAKHEKAMVAEYVRMRGHHPS